MYGTNSFDEKVPGNGRNTDYNIRESGDSGRRFLSPRDESRRYVSRNRYASPRSLGKSMSRRNGGLVRCKIANGSLNFDSVVEGTAGGGVISGRRRRRRRGSVETIATSVSLNSTDESNRRLHNSAEGVRYLSRSAKILRALNINYSPLLDPGPKSSSDGSGPSVSVKKRIPDDLSNASSKSPFSRISKTLEFDTSSSGSSNFNGYLDSSLESTDENQNQTPSRKNGKEKGESMMILQENEDNRRRRRRRRLVSLEEAPNIQKRLEKSIDDDSSSADGKKNYSTPKPSILIHDFSSSTPKNLYYEFENDEEDDGEENLEKRPKTPENSIVKLIPESTSAIKKSHKKERLSGRNVVEDVEDDCVDNYDDEEDCNVSESGSIFDYSEKQPKTQEKSLQPSNRDSNAEISKSEENRRSARNLLDEFGNLDGGGFDKTAKINEETKEHQENPEIAEESANSSLPTEKSEKPTEKVDFPTKSDRNDRPGTPENSINYLQCVITDSIKRSHKKIKDARKKSILKGKLLANDEQIDENRDRIAEDRAATPENTNSSRLLLSQFSSVKKSHRKDKHGRKNASETASTKRFRPLDDENPSTSSDCQFLLDIDCSSSNNNSFSSCASDLSIAHENLQLLEPGVSINVKSVREIAAISSLPIDNSEFSPNKRKNDLQDESFRVLRPDDLFHDSFSISNEYQSAEEEFKIFTPIKKRKSLQIASSDIAKPKLMDKSETHGDSSLILANNSTEDRQSVAETCNDASRCSTPTTARGKHNFQLSRCNLETPEKTGRKSTSPSLGEPGNGPDDDPSGRSTPQNDSTVEFLIGGIGSIKKSHKKDKRGSVSRRSFIRAQEEQRRRDEDHRKRENSPQPSTSQETNSSALSVPRCSSPNERNLENDNDQAKTPPNCLTAKNYLRLLQTTSIKRSHKKVRDRKRFAETIQVVDHENPAELSDDGSIFESSDKEENSNVADDETNEGDSLLSSGRRRRRRTRRHSSNSPELDGNEDHFRMSSY